MANNINVSNVTDNIKAINFETWGGLDGFLSATSNGAGGSTKPQQLRRVVPWLAKATDMTAAAVSNLPFYILRENGDVYDYSGNYENKLGGLPNPESLFYLLAASLCVGRAYLIPTTTSNLLAKWQYCAPQSIKAEIGADGVKWFDRTTDKGKKERLYPYSENKSPKLLYFWLPDPDVEIGEPLAFPAGDALMAANLLYSMDSTISVYSERGFVPPTLLAVKGMPAANERERAETWWNRFLRGWTKEAAKILNAETMDVKQVGAGMTELKGAYTELTKQAIENIGTAFGIPSGLFMSDMSYATEVKHLIKLWYSTSAFIKIYKTIESTFNEQLLAQWGLKLKFAPDELEAFQEEEAERAAAFKVYVDAGFKRSWAAQMVGLDLPEGVEADMLDQYAEEQDQLKAEREKEQFTARWGNKYGAEAQKPDDMEKKPVKAKTDGGHWVTINGDHVFIDEHGNAQNAPYLTTEQQYSKDPKMAELEKRGRDTTLSREERKQAFDDRDTIEKVIGMKYDDGSPVRETIDGLVKDGFDHIVIRGPRAYLANKGNERLIPITSKVERDYAEFVLREIITVNKSISLTSDQIKELNLWRQIAERNVKKGKGACADFEVKALDESVAGTIRAKLLLARNVEDVTAAFEVGNEKGYMKELDIQRMIDALEANLFAIEAEVKAAPDNYTFPVTVNVPAPVVSMMPAPVVNIEPAGVYVTNEVNPTPINNVVKAGNVTVEPTPVTVNNEVNVPEPTVIIKSKPKRVTVTRNGKGEVTSLEANG